MSEMLERVARVLEPQAWAALGTGDTLAYQSRRTSSLRKARAAIAAMREPTLAMASAYHEAIDKWMKMECEFEDVLGAVLDAALSEPEGEQQ